MDTSTNVQLDEAKAEVLADETVSSELDPKQIMAEVERLRSTNNRLLEESKKYKNQKRETELKLMEAEGRKDEIITTLRQQLEEKDKVLSEHEEMTIRQRIAHKVAEKAQKYGCEDWDQLYVLGRNELIDYDRESGEIRGIDSFFEDALKNDKFKKFFIKPDKVRTNNSISNANPHDWKKDPIPYLRQLKKDGRMGEYNKAIGELEREGLLK